MIEIKSEDYHLDFILDGQGWLFYCWPAIIIKHNRSGVALLLLACYYHQALLLSFSLSAPENYVCILLTWTLMKRWLPEPPIADSKSNLKMTQDCLDAAYVSWQCDTFKIDNPFIYHSWSWGLFIHETEKEYSGQLSCVLMSIGDFLTLTTWPRRPHKLEESCRTLTMMVRRKERIRTSMLYYARNITNNGESCRSWLQWYQP